MYVFGIFRQVSGACQTVMREEKSYTGYVAFVKCQNSLLFQPKVFCLLKITYLCVDTCYKFWDVSSPIACYDLDICSPLSPIYTEVEVVFPL